MDKDYQDYQWRRKWTSAEAITMVEKRKTRTSLRVKLMLEPVLKNSLAVSWAFSLVWRCSGLDLMVTVSNLAPKQRLAINIEANVNNMQPPEHFRLKSTDECCHILWNVVCVRCCTVLLNSWHDLVYCQTLHCLAKGSIVWNVFCEMLPCFFFECHVS